MSLDQRALCLVLTIREWSGRKHDRQVSKDVAQQHGTTSDAGRYNKQLLRKNGPLDKVHKKTRWIRQQLLYKETLPWAFDGTQLLASKNYLGFMEKYRKESAEWIDLAATFNQEYLQLKEQARLFLPNGLYNEADYPSADQMAQKFSIDLAVFPVPTTDVRVEQVSDSERAQMVAELDARWKATEAQAMQECWNRLYKRVKHIVTTLSDPKATFHDTLTENALELCELLPRLNFTDDPALEQMRQEVEQLLANVTPSELRTNLTQRQNTANETKAIMAKMAGYMGA
jgi:hypothetical protein